MKRNMKKKKKMKNDQKQLKSPGCQPDVAVLNAFYGPNGPRSYKSNLIGSNHLFCFLFKLIFLYSGLFLTVYISCQYI